MVKYASNTVEFASIHDTEEKMIGDVMEMVNKSSGVLNDTKQWMVLTVKPLHSSKFEIIEPRWDDWTVKK